MNKFQKFVLRAIGIRVKDPAPNQRMYSNAVPSRLNQGFPSFNTSEDLELVSSLRNMRARSRALVRDAGYAQSAQRVIVNNVIGTGVKMRSIVKTDPRRQQRFHQQCD